MWKMCTISPLHLKIENAAFHSQLVESTDAKSTDSKDQLCIYWKKSILYLTHAVQTKGQLYCKFILLFSWGHSFQKLSFLFHFKKFCFTGTIIIKDRHMDKIRGMVGVGEGGGFSWGGGEGRGEKAYNYNWITIKIFLKNVF